MNPAGHGQRFHKENTCDDKISFVFQLIRLNIGKDTWCTRHILKVGYCTYYVYVLVNLTPG